nr:hypothetical protein [Tanacetum cinerariifolium]
GTDEVIKSSVEDFIPIPSESEDTSRIDSKSDLPSCDDFSPINVPEGKSVTFSNPLFDSNDDFSSSDDESLSDEDVLEDIESKFSYDSNLDDPDLLVTPLSDANEDECFDPGDDVDEIELLLHHDPSTPKMSVASILEGFTNEPPLEENDDLLDLESKENEWDKILYDAPINDLMTEDKVPPLRILKKFFSPTYNEDTIFDPVSPLFIFSVGGISSEWNFQPMFDEYLNPLPCVDLQVPTVIAPELVVSTVIPLGVEDSDHNIEVAHMDNSPCVDFTIPEPKSEESSS